MSFSVSLMFKLVKSLLDDPAILDAPVTWQSNGERGFRHFNARCHKIKRGARMVFTTDTIEATLSKRACPDCSFQAVTSKVENSSGLMTLLRVREEVDSLRSRDFAKAKLEHLHTYLQQLRRAAASLRDLDDGRLPVSEFRRGLDETRALVVNATADVTTVLSSRRLELVLPVAIDAIQTAPTRAGSPDLMVTEQERKVLGDAGVYHARVVSRLFQIWSQGRVQSDDVSSREEMMAKLDAFVQLSNLSQLESVPLIVADDAGEAMRVSWRAERDRIARSLFDRWDARVADIIADDSQVLVGFAMPRGGSRLHLVHQVADSFVVAANDAADVRVLRVPASVAGWLQDRVSDVVGPLRVPAIQVLAAEADDAVLDTAVALWDPAAPVDGPYVRFEGCMSAASALLAS